MTTTSDLKFVALSALGVLLCLGAGGCANHPPAPVTQAPVLTAANLAPAPTPIFTIFPVSPGLSVSPDLAAACKLELNDIAKAPKFGFDESNLDAEDAEVLSQIAKCVTMGGALAGRALDLVGRADSRGETEYNMALGARRASAVRERLFTLGVDNSRMGESSLGELDATGTEENGWRRDRRVDISLR